MSSGFARRTGAHCDVRNSCSCTGTRNIVSFAVHGDIKNSNLGPCYIKVRYSLDRVHSSKPNSVVEKCKLVVLGERKEAQNL